jgi:hypothetical protein
MKRASESEINALFLSGVSDILSQKIMTARLPNYVWLHPKFVTFLLWGQQRSSIEGCLISFDLRTSSYHSATLSFFPPLNHHILLPFISSGLLQCTNPRIVGPTTDKYKKQRRKENPPMTLIFFGTWLAETFRGMGLLLEETLKRTKRRSYLAELWK